MSNYKEPSLLVTVYNFARSIFLEVLEDPGPDEGILCVLGLRVGIFFYNDGRFTHVGNGGKEFFL